MHFLPHVESATRSSRPTPFLDDRRSQRRRETALTTQTQPA